MVVVQVEQLVVPAAALRTLELGSTDELAEFDDDEDFISRCSRLPLLCPSIRTRLATLAPLLRLLKPQVLRCRTGGPGRT